MHRSGTHCSTTEFLNRLKPASKNSDKFPLSVFEDPLPRQTVIELERRELEETSHAFAEIEHARLRARQL